MKRWTASRITAAIVLSLCALVVASVALGAYLMPNDPVEAADAIVVISGGGPERLAHGVRLFNDGHAPRLVLSGDARDPDSPSNADSMRAAAVDAGVPDEAIMVDPTAWTTYENAQRTRELLPDRVATIILVTSPYHQRRALEAFRDVYGPGVSIVSSPAPVGFFTPWGWWRTKTGRRLFFSEYGKLLYVRFTGKHDRG